MPTRAEKSLKEEMHDILDEYLQSHHFESTIVRYTKKTCNDIVKAGLIYVTPLAAIIISLVVYIFTNFTDSIKQLEVTTNELSATVKLFEERTRNNQEAIRHLLQNPNRN